MPRTLVWHSGVMDQPESPEVLHTASAVPCPPADRLDSVSALTDAVSDFAARRNWGQFHDPKSLLLALVGEVGEVAELMQWTREGAVAAELGSGDGAQRIRDELADVFLYLVRLADVLNVDLADAAWEKLARNETRFPPVNGV